MLVELVLLKRHVGRVLQLLEDVVGDDVVVERVDLASSIAPTLISCVNVFVQLAKCICSDLKYICHFYRDLTILMNLFFQKIVCFRWVYCRSNEEEIFDDLHELDKLLNESKVSVNVSAFF